jgi:Zn-dependent peptidase ImmA (M78 family)
VNVIRADVLAQASRMLEVLESRSPGAAERLHADPLAELTAWTEIRVAQVPDTQSDSRCSVAGGYLHDTNPPTLTVTRSLSGGRQQFTALHELGHHLQKTDARLGLAVRRQPANREAFEDAACDAFASRVLLPDDALTAWPTDRSPRAADIVAMFEQTQASRAACCVRAVERLHSHGFVAVLDAEGTVTFAAGRGDVFPPARGTSQAATPLVAAALRRRTSAQVDTTYVRYGDGSTSLELYGDAAWSNDYLIAVAVMDRPGWKPFAPPRTGSARFVSREVTCEVCETDFEPADRCSRCGMPRCPTGHCNCTLAAERMCEGCFQKLHPARFAGPTARRCKDCAG